MVDRHLPLPDFEIEAIEDVAHDLAEIERTGNELEAAAGDHRDIEHLDDEGGEPLDLPFQQRQLLRRRPRQRHVAASADVR